jgi:hypothetical protein
MITLPTSLTLSPITAYPRDRHNQTSAPAEKTWTGSREMNRLLTAAVVSRKFCQLLLTEPQVAMRNGYNGEAFHLAADEVALILSIQATSLCDFADQLLKADGNYARQHGAQQNDLEEIEALPMRTRRVPEKALHAARFAEVSL